MHSSGMSTPCSCYWAVRIFQPPPKPPKRTPGGGGDSFLILFDLQGLTHGGTPSKTTPMKGWVNVDANVWDVHAR